MKHNQRVGDPQTGIAYNFQDTNTTFDDQDIPLASKNNAYTNCLGRTVALGDGLFYAHLIGLDNTMNQTLLQDLAIQYTRDLSANVISSPVMISLESTHATGSHCAANVCPRYEWFSKVMLSGIIADLVYANHGCTSCSRIDVTDAAFLHNIGLELNFGDGMRDNGQDWVGHYYPRGIISWAFLNANY